MNYRYAIERRDSTDLSSGRVLVSLPGHPALPVRLTDELFSRCLAHWRATGSGGPVSVYDPCCGAAYHLAVIGFLHAADLESLLGSDVLPEAVTVARRNLSLLSDAGLSSRALELDRLMAEYGKDSHRDARASLERLRVLLQDGLAGRTLTTGAFVCDALADGVLPSVLEGRRPEIVLADVPYGLHSTWLSAAVGGPRAPLDQLLHGLQPVLRPGSVLGIVSDKTQKPTHTAYERLEQFNVGRRRVVILRWVGGS